MGRKLAIIIIGFALIGLVAQFYCLKQIKNAGHTTSKEFDEFMEYWRLNKHDYVTIRLEEK